MLATGSTHGAPEKTFSSFGPAVWPGIANIQTNIYERRALLYRRIVKVAKYIEKKNYFMFYKMYL